jgi:hypothetical protein
MHLSDSDDTNDDILLQLERVRELVHGNEVPLESKADVVTLNLPTLERIMRRTPEEIQSSDIEGSLCTRIATKNI